MVQKVQELMFMFGKMVATAKYFVENNLDDKAVLKESTNPLFNKYLSEDCPL